MHSKLTIKLESLKPEMYFSVSALIVILKKLIDKFWNNYTGQIVFYTQNVWLFSSLPSLAMPNSVYIF